MALNRLSGSFRACPLLRLKLPSTAWQYFGMKEVTQIIRDAAGRTGKAADAVWGKVNEHRKLVGGAVGAAAMAPFYGRIYDIGREASGIIRRGMTVKAMSDDASGQSDDVKHRRRILNYMQRRILQSEMPEY